MLFRSKPKPDKTQLPATPADIGGVRVLRSLRARRMALRVDPRRGDVVLTLPRRASEKAALKFVEENRAWIEKHRRESAPVSIFAPGGVVPVAGRDLTVVHAPGRGLTRIDGDRLVVHGQLPHLSRRIRDFLKKEAAEILQQKSTEKAAQLGLPPVAVRVIDPKTRWGSCAPDGRLMYSWRLILAPPAVLDYVVAHEVAHRVHLNHGKRFWTLCASLTEDVPAARRWLNAHGKALMSYI